MTVATGEGIVGRRRDNGQQFEVDGEGGRSEGLPDVWPPYSPNGSWRGFLTLAPLFRDEHILPQGHRNENEPRDSHHHNLRVWDPQSSPRMDRHGPRMNIGLGVVGADPEGEERASESPASSRSGNRAARHQVAPQNDLPPHQPQTAAHYPSSFQQHLPPLQQSPPCPSTSPLPASPPSTHLLPSFIICTHQYSSSMINIKIEIPSCQQHYDP